MNKDVIKADKFDKFNQKNRRLKSKTRRAKNKIAIRSSLNGRIYAR